MNRRMLPLAAALVLTLSVSPVFAQSKKELVSRLLALQQPGVEAMAKNLAEQPAVQMTLAARQAFGNVPAEKRDAVAKSIDAELKRYTDESVPLLRERAIKMMPSTIGTELETNFNEGELKQLIEWFESPVIKRFQSMAPAMQRTMSEKLVSETRAQIEPKLKALEAGMAKHLGLPPPGAAPAGGTAGPGGAAAGSGGGAPMPGNRGGEAPKK